MIEILSIAAILICVVWYDKRLDDKKWAEVRSMFPHIKAYLESKSTCNCKDCKCKEE